VARAEVRAALVELGYAPEEIRGALDRVSPEENEDSVEELLRGALRELASR
jgi:Holliday junction resolvasome RuvABC DNA-binding subunit